MVLVLGLGNLLPLFACAQNVGVARGLSSNINPFTGDFNYTLPLVTVTGPNGEAFPVGVTYNAGIGMNQEASWVGLGWNLGIGEIRRQVRGMPDDWNGKTLEQKKYVNGNLTPEVETKTYFGPMYFHNLSAPNYQANEQLDIYQSDFAPNDGISPFTFPDYDAFFVSGPGISGQMQMHLFDYANLYSGLSEANGTTYYFYDDDPDDPEPFTKFDENKRPHFRFKHEPTAKIKAPYYGAQEWDEATNSYVGGGQYSWGMLDNTNTNLTFKTPDDLAGQDYSEDYNPATNCMFGSFYIEYFTNQEITDHYAAVFDVQGVNQQEIPSFSDFQIVDNSSIPYDYRSNGRYDPDGIGAFRITSPNGVVYHYTLPAYNSDERVSTVDLNDDLQQGASATITTKNADYAYSWKLTAITGVDYSDTNQNGIVDAPDNGYWIALDYTLWLDDFQWRSPFFGYNYDQVGKRVALTTQPFVDGRQERYQATGTMTQGSSDLIYLDAIKTSTQSLFFIKDLRQDAHSVNTAQGHFPKLRLDQLVLLDNSDVDATWFDDGTTLPAHDFPNIANLPTPINTLQYDEDRAAIEAVSLKTVAFNHDYKLAPKLYNNIDNEFAESSVSYQSTSDVMYYDGELSGSAVGGKLTLNEINSFEYGHSQEFPGYKFTYHETNADGEPYEFDHERKDFFGFYKRNFDANSKGGYLSSKEVDDVKAWSLKRITLPLGAELEVEYESDIYAAVGYESPSVLPVGVTRTFRITDVYQDPSNPTDNNKPVIRFFDSDALQLFNDDAVNSRSMEQRVQSISTGSQSNINALQSLEGTWDGTSDFIQVTAGLHASNAANDYDEVTLAQGWLKLHMDYAYGGGLRVKTISLTDPETGEKYSLAASYDEGVCTAEPDRFGPMYLGSILQANKYGNDRHSIAPAVGYSNVTFKIVGDAGHALGSTEYKFNNWIDTYKPIAVKAVVPGVNENNFYEVIKIHEDNSLYGRLKSIANLDKHGNRVTFTKYIYGSAYDQKGKVEEVFYRLLYAPSSPNNNESTWRTVYYKTQLQNYLLKKISYENGVETITLYLDRDDLTGAVTRTEIVDPTDVVTEIVKTPLYQNDVLYSELGPKHLNPNNQHQLAAIETEQFFRDGVLVGGTHSVWKNVHAYRVYNPSNAPLKYGKQDQTTLWTPVESYRFNGQTDVANWKYTGELTLMGSNDLLLERKDMDDFYSASKFGYDQRFKIAEASNTNYVSFTHCTFESQVDENGTQFFDGEVGPNLTLVNSNGTINAHTGNAMTRVDAGVSAKAYVAALNNSGGQESGLHRGRTYRASVWVHNASPADAKIKVELDGTSALTYSSSVEVAKNDGEITAGNWTLLSIDILVPADYTSTGGDDLKVSLLGGTGGPAFFDDFRIHPIDAAVQAYVVDVKRGLTLYTIDTDNFYTRYEYDAAGRVIKAFVETTNGEVKISESEFGFSRLNN